jgi:hypothetical protein
MKRLLQDIVSEDKVYCQVCKVTKVGDMTCDVVSVSTDLPIPDVRLKAHLEGDNGIIVKPAKDSFVLVAFLSSRDAYVAMCDKVDSVSIKIGSTTFEMDKDYIKMNGGSLKGLIKILSLVDRMNAIEDFCNNLLTDYKAHNHNHPQGATTTFVVPPQLGNVEKTKVDDLENKKITHG